MAKQLFDTFFSLFICTFLLLWLVPLLALVIYFSSYEFPFYTQERVGKNGVKFNIFKFRSMKGQPPVNDPLLSKEESSRITPLGKFLRKYRIDELPQFFNVLKGNMSVVGPRPERQHFLNKILKEIPKYTQLQQLKPGITSLGQIRYGYADNFQQMKLRARYDLVYLNNQSLLTDFKIILYTVLIVLKGKGR